MPVYNKWATVEKTWVQHLDNVEQYFGDAKDVSLKWNGTNLQVLPVTDDTGALHIGDGTTDFDVKIFLGTTSLYAQFDVGAAALILSAGVVFTLGSTTQVTVSNGDGATNMVPASQTLGLTAAAGAVLAATFNTTNTRAVSPHIALVKGAAATQVATTAVADNEVIGSIIAYGSDGTDFETPVAAIEFVVDDVGGPGTGAIGGSIEVYTTADGGETLTIAFTVDNIQNIMGGNAAGPAIATGEAATSTNPTLIPDKAEMDTGIGWASDTLHVVLGGATTANFGAVGLSIANAYGVLIGGATQVLVGAVTPELQVVGTAPADSSMALVVGSADAAAPRLYFGKGRDAIGTYTTPVTTGDILGQILAFGSDGVDLNSNGNASAAIYLNSTGTIAPDRVPGTITFYTATDAQPSVLTLAMTLGADQSLAVVGNTRIGSATTANLTGANRTLVVGSATSGEEAEVAIVGAKASTGTMAYLSFASYFGTATKVLIARIYVDSPSYAANDGDGRLVFQTRPIGGALTTRLSISGPATAVATWANITHTGFNSSGDIILSGGGRIIKQGDDNTYFLLLGGTATAGRGAMLALYGKDSAANSLMKIATPNADNSADVDRLAITGDVAISTITWAACTHTGFIATNSIQLGTAGSALGTLNICGNTSGTVSVTVAAAAGTWTFTLPTTAGEAGDVMVTNGSGVASWVSGMRSVDVQLTNAQLLALLGTDIQLVAAPGANRAIVVHAIYMYLVVDTTAYTIGAAQLQINYASDGADIAQLTEAGWLDTVANAGRWYQLGGATATPDITVPVANVGVVMRSTGADMTGGNANNTLSVRVYYSVVDVAAFT